MLLAVNFKIWDRESVYQFVEELTGTKLAYEMVGQRKIVLDCKDVDYTRKVLEQSGLVNSMHKVNTSIRGR